MLRAVLFLVLDLKVCCACYPVIPIGWLCSDSESQFSHFPSTPSTGACIVCAAVLCGHCGLCLVISKLANKGPMSEYNIQATFVKSSTPPTAKSENVHKLFIYDYSSHQCIQSEVMNLCFPLICMGT